MKSVAQKSGTSNPESGISGRLSISGRLIFDTPKSMFFIENVSKTLFFRACGGPKSRENIANGTELRDSPVSRITRLLGDRPKPSARARWVLLLGTMASRDSWKAVTVQLDKANVITAPKRVLNLKRFHMLTCVKNRFDPSSVSSNHNCLTISSCRRTLLKVTKVPGENQHFTIWVDIFVFCEILLKLLLKRNVFQSSVVNTNCQQR